MGNHITCCRQRWFQLTNDNLSDDTPNDEDCDAWRKSCYFNSGAVFNNEPLFCNSAKHQSEPSVPDSGITTSGQRWATQHISEREPEDLVSDPSFNASRHALFLTSVDKTCAFSRSLTQVPKDFSSVGSRSSGLPRSGLRKWSSCSMAYIGDGWLVFPKQSSVLRSISIAIELLFDSIMNQTICKGAFGPSDTSTFLQFNHDVYNLFDERKYPLVFKSTNKFNAVPPLALDHIPREHDFHAFIQILFRSSFLGPQAAIVALIFLERLVNAAEIGLTIWSWRRQLLACVLLASKVLDDQAVWNTDYRRVLKDVPVEDLNALERHTLSLLQFNINVPLAVYARYYFDLLSVGEARGVTNRLSDRRLLTADVARQLQILPGSEDPASSYIRSLFGFTVTNEPPADAKRRSRRVNESRNSATIHSRSSSCHPRFTSLDHSGITQSISSSPHFILSPDEGPLILDEETDFINTLTIPALSSTKYQPLSSIDHPSDLSCRISRNRSSSISGSMFGKRAKTPGYELLLAGSSLTNDSDQPCTEQQSNGLGFMRSVMGGDVAYTLLREAGMY